MAERHAILNSRAISTLLRKTDRVSRISDGFGDFCFFPKPDKCLTCDTPSWVPKPKVIDDGEEVVPSLILQRSGFPFLRLPKEIREKIYNYCIVGFRNPWQNGRIKIDVGVVHNRRCHPFRNGYEMRVLKAISKDDDIASSGEHRHVKTQDYNTVFFLSQVSHQVRAELGAIFWNNTYIDSDHWEYLLIDFLKERPAVHKGIKKLRMCWDCEEGPYDLNESIIELCEYLSNHVLLDELEFVFGTTVEVMQMLVASEGRIAWVRAFKKIRVQKLKVNLWIAGEHEDDEEDDFGLDDDWDDDVGTDDSNSEGLHEEDSEAEQGDEVAGGNGQDVTEERPLGRQARLIKEWTARMEELLGPPVQTPEMSN